MKRWLLWLALSAVSYAQTLPSNGLAIQYDMLTTGGGGTTLTDLSGNGRNGTITGTTTNAQGRVFNGTTDFITIPQVIGNSNFTVMAIIQPNSGGAYNGGSVWSENDNTNNCGSGSCIRFSTDSAIQSLVIGSGGSAAITGTVAYRFPDFDVWMMSRQSQQINWAMISRGLIGQGNTTKQAVKFSATTTVSTSVASIGNVIKSGGNINFWGGEISYFVLYNRVLSQQELQTVYAFMANAVYSRGVFLHPFPIFQPYTKPVWLRQGAVISQVNGSACTEPDVIFDNNLQLISTSSGFGFKLICTGTGTGGPGIEYSESPDGFAWTSRATTIIAGKNRGAFLKVNSTYHMYVEQSPAVAFDHYTSPDGINWTLAQSSILQIGGVGTWDHTNIDNPSVVFNSNLTPSWYMTYEGTPGTQNHAGEIGCATSPDGATWTKCSANPVTGTPGDPFPEQTCYGAKLQFINSTWYLWCGNFQALKRFRSPTFNDLWIWDQFHASIIGTAYNETNQIGDPSILQAPCPANINATVGAQCSFIYYWPSGQNGQFTSINLAIANMPLSLLVATNEGATTDYP